MTNMTQPHPHPAAPQGHAPMQPRPVPMPAAPVPHPVQPGMAPQPAGQFRPQAVPQPMPQGARPQAVPQPTAHMPHGQQMPQPGYPQQQTMPQASMPQGGMPAPGNLLDYAGHAPASAPAMGQRYAPLAEDNRDEGEKPLPSISVQAFCDRQETAHCINETTRDWRMKRTNVKIYMGGLPAAIEFYHKENTPSLIIIESGMRGEELFNQLEQLASVCDEGTKVVMIGAANDIRLYRQLMDKGVSDYLVPPLHPLHVIRSLGELYSDPEQPFIGRVAAFFGAKGGVGSSALAHNTAWILAENLGQETALIDLDASWGTTGLDFSYDNMSGLEEALGEPDRLIS